jgi:hypothetical protein
MWTIDRRRVAVALCVITGTMLVACERKPPARPADSVAPTTPPAAPSAPPAERPAVSQWDPAAGTALLVHDEGGDAYVVVPGEAGDSATDRTAGDASDVLPADVALFSRAGSAGHARAVPVDSSSNDCAWPTARIGPASGAEVLPSWTVGFVGASPTSIALDSIEGATAADSATLAAAVTRLAAALPDDTTRAFRGLPFTVRSARRFTIGDGTREGVVAVLTRAVNQEAAPLSERLLLVAERPRSGGTTAWTVAYHERASGREDDVPATDVLAAVALGPTRRPTLVLARALSDGTRYGLLERTGDLTWRVRWTSATRGC